MAFESIDGPPPEVFRKLVANLNDEAGARQIAVVSRNGAATYRVRGYVSALVERGKTTFAWVWDIYDTDKRRTLRIAGEEPAAAGRSGRDAWSGADEQVLRRMARDGMDRIAGFLNSSRAAGLPSSPNRPWRRWCWDATIARRGPESSGCSATGISRPTACRPKATADKPLPPKAAKSRAKAGSAAAPAATQSASLSPSTDGRSSDR